MCIIDQQYCRREIRLGPTTSRSIVTTRIMLHAANPLRHNVSSTCISSPLPKSTQCVREKDPIGALDSIVDTAYGPKCHEWT